jgi:hypothetical protein
MTLRVTWYFVDTTSEVADGWTETFYSPGSDPVAELRKVQPGSNLFNFRRSILSQDFRIVRIRAVDVTNRQLAWQQGVHGSGGVGQSGNLPNSSSNSAAVWTSVLVRLGTGGQGVRQFPLRGLPQGVIRDSTDFNPANGNWNIAFNAWRNAMTGGGINVNTYNYVLRRANPSDIAIPTNVTITGNLRGLTLHYPPPSPADALPGKFIVLTGIAGANNCNGRWKVSGNNGTDIVLKPRLTNIFGAPTVPARVQLMNWLYPTISSATPIRGMTRKTGRPSISLRGRARVRRA